MCGIAGIAGLTRVNAAAVRAMDALMAHRGPDGDEIWQAEDGRVCLGNRRLAVLDLSRDAGQPMRSGDGAFTITYNGELYNYLELKQKLREQGAVFRTSSDTEVVIEAYHHWGEACLDEFNGMFAFAIFDSRRNVLFCARDRFGEKPFLFVERPGIFAFASEYKALFVLDGVGVDVDAHGLFRFLHDPSRGLDHQRRTVFRGISQLMPAEKLVLNLHDLSWKAERYWTGEARAGENPMPEADAVRRLRDLVTDAVRIRLRSDVPVGSCLSGGLDSSAVTCLSRRLLGDDRPYHVFTGRFPDSAADEGRWAGEVVAATGVTQHETFPSADRFVAEAEQFIWFNELPVDSASQYAQWCVFKLAAENGVTVLLDGQGADEVLGGYEQYFAPYMRSRRRVLGAREAEAEERAIRDRYPLAFSTADQSWKKRAPLWLRRMAARVTGQGSDLLFGVKSEFTAEVATTLESNAPDETLHRALRRDACNGFLTSLLRYGDRNSMAHSREVRLPFCDHRIAEFVFGLPERLIMGNAETKHLLREAMRGILPEPVRVRWNKQGFLPPHAQWFRDGLGRLAGEIFDSPSFAGSPMWDAVWWRRAMRRLSNGDDTLAVQIWKPVIAELWQRNFVGRMIGQPRIAPLAAADR